MTRYEILLSLGDNFVKLIAKGFIPVHVLDWKVYYEAYMTEREKLEKECGKLKKGEAVSMVAANYDLSKRAVYTVINFMEGA